MVLARQIPVAISSCPLIQLEQTLLLFLLCFQKSKFFTVEDLCRFWHLWTDFNYANVPSIYTFLSRNIYYCLPATIWIDLHYLYSIPVMFLAFRPEFRDLHLYFFFLWLDAFVTWCYLSNLTTKNASWNLLFFQMCLSDRTSLKLLQQHYGQIWKTKSEFLFWVEKFFFNKEIWHFLIQNQPCPK